MNKKILASLVALFIFVGLVPQAMLAEGETYVAWIGETGYETLEAAVTAAQSGDTITLGEGKYTLYNKGAQTKGKDLTFVGQDAGKTEWGIGATIPDPSKFGTEYNGDYSFDGAGTITFKNMTLQSGTVKYLGFIRANNTIVEDCTINGQTFYWGYTSATFKNTTFNAPNWDYALWTYSSPTMTFDTCTFNTTGKVINVYRDYSGAAYTINFKDCTVNNTVIASKQVLNINDSFPSGQSYVINISGINTITNTDGHVALNPDNITCSRLFGFSGKTANNAGNTTVTIDGTTVWKNGKMVTHEIDCTNDKYTEGYKDNAYTYTYGEWETNEQGISIRTVTKVCDYCGHKEESTEAKLNVIYDPNGGTGDAVNKEYTIAISGDEISTDIETITNSFKRDGYEFIGWNTKADGTGEAYGEGTTLTITSDLTLYAEWKKKEVTPTPTVEPKKTTGYDDGGPFTTDTCGNVFDRWGNKIYEAKGCSSGYELVRTSAD